MKGKGKFILLIVLTGGIIVHAQSDCSQALIQAERAYYIGRFNEVQPLLQSCLANGFDKDQKTEAYKLIALSSIFSRNFEQADSALLLMLKNNPQYEFNAQDPPEFRRRVASFNIHPLIEVTANIGLLQPFFSVTEVYNTRIIPATITYTGKTGIHYGLSTAYYLNKRISVRLGYAWQRYSFTVQNQDHLATSVLNESQSRTQWQAAMGYGFLFRKINFQLYGGIAYGTLNKADASLELNRIDNLGQIDYNFSNLGQRTVHEVRPSLELKVNVPQKNKWMVSLAMRYEVGLTNITNASNRVNSLGHAGVFEWVEDDFKGRYFTVTVGISKLFYSVKLNQK